MTPEKEDFLRRRLLPLLRSIPLETPPRWGKMTLQQMVEHLSDMFRIASGRLQYPSLVTPQENLPKMLEFLLSEKPFRENTVNPLLPETPAPVRTGSMDEALAELGEEVQHFFAVFEANPHLTTLNPFFGSLNFEENVQLLHKHAGHHLRQFGVQPEAEK